MLKLKRKLALRGHLYLQAVRPDIVLRALHWLKVRYSEVTVDTENIDRTLSELQLQPISGNDSEVSSNSNVYVSTKQQINKMKKRQRILWMNLGLQLQKHPCSQFYQIILSIYSARVR